MIVWKRTIFTVPLGQSVRKLSEGPAAGQTEPPRRQRGRAARMARGASSISNKGCKIRELPEAPFRS